MPSPPGYKRDYKQEAKTAKRRGEQGTGSNAGSAIRHRARRKMLKKKKVKKGQDVHHKSPLRRTSANANRMSNLAATSPGKNRSFSRKK